MVHQHTQHAARLQGASRCSRQPLNRQVVVTIVPSRNGEEKIYGSASFYREQMAIFERGLRIRIDLQITSASPSSAVVLRKGAERP